MDIQRQICKELTRIAAGGSAHFVVRHPVMSQQPLAGVSIEVNSVRDAGYEADEVVVEIRPEPRGVSAALLWQLTLRVLISIEPPEQSWDRYADTYSTIGTPGTWGGRVEGLRPLVARNVLAASQPDTSHLTHRKHLAGHTIKGDAVRALCGTFFVPRQDHRALPTCPTCQDRWDELPDS